MLKYTFLILPLCFYTTRAQEIKPAASIEERLSQSGRMILEAAEYRQRDSANQYFGDLLFEYLQTEEGFEHPLSQVKNMMRLSGPKDEFHIYTWQIPDSLYEYRQMGMLAVKSRRGIIVSRLEDRSAEMMEAEFKRGKADDWYGAIYYQIIPVRKNGKHLYTLLGYSPGQQVNRKVIEVMSIDKRGKPTFGERIFKVDNFMDKVFRKPPLRLLLSYGGDYAASVKWNEKEEKIVMDHLAPPDPKLKGLYQQYGPDMSYDALEWDDDWWEFHRDVKFQNEQHIRIVPPSKPVGPPPGR